MSQMAKFANNFGSVVKQAAQAAAKEKTTLQETLANLNEQRKALDAQIKELDKQLDSIDEDVHAAILHCLRDEGFRPYTDVTHAPRGSKNTDVSDADTATVLDAIGEGKASAMTFGQISKAAGVDGSIASIAIRQLLADDKLKAEGERRGKKYFK